MRPTRQLSRATAAILAAAIVPVLAGARPGEEPARAAAIAVPPACGLTTATVNYPGTGGPITDATATYVPGTYTVLVSGVGPFLADVDLRTTIAHTDCSELDITLRSPAGTKVTITTDNGGANDNVFNGTLWDDASIDVVTDHVFANLVTATPLAPEGRLEAFRGENPNGTWTLTVADDTAADLGTVTDWSLTITTLAGPPTPATTVYTQTPNVPIRDGGSIVGIQLASGLGTFLAKTVLYTEIPHADASEVDLFLQSPGGTVVRLTTDNGGTNDNVFNGTLWDGDSTDPVTDHGYGNLTVATMLSPEGGFDPLLGTDPNGIWTLIATDDTSGTNTGRLQRWDLALTTIPTPSPSAPVQFSGTTGPIPDFVSGSTATPTVFLRNVAGAGPVLWDVDLSTAIQHTSCGDLDMTLTSPAGTTVVLTTDNGGTLNHVFNGTTWDDNANVPVGDQTFADSVAATPLTPEGRLTAFRGENPNGNWTLTITDDTVLDAGTLASWSLDLSTVPVLPNEASTTISQLPNLVFSTAAPPQIHSNVINVAGAGTSITEIEVYLEITHTFGGDLDITLTSPVGTVVTVTTDNGGLNDNVYNGTLWDGDSTDPVSEHVYTNLVVATPLGPESSFDNFLGQDPNGNWTMTISDDASGDGGTWRRWDLIVRTCNIPAPVAYCFGDGSSLACPCSPAPVPHGAPGRGCPTNVFAGGALLTASGASSLSGDSLVLTGTDMINGSMIFFQGPTQQSGGAGVAFGDGKRCIQPTSIRRFKTKPVAGNTASYPVGVDTPISVAGNILAPGVRHYQGWYRSANPTFCTPDTFNLTNGLTVTWGP